MADVHEEADSDVESKVVDQTAQLCGGQRHQTLQALDCSWENKANEAEGHDEYGATLPRS